MKLKEPIAKISKDEQRIFKCAGKKKQNKSRCTTSKKCKSKN